MIMILIIKIDVKLGNLNWEKITHKTRAILRYYFDKLLWKSMYLYLNLMSPIIYQKRKVYIQFSS